MRMLTHEILLSVVNLELKFATEQSADSIWIPTYDVHPLPAPQSGRKKLQVWSAAANPSRSLIETFPWDKEISLP